MPTPEQLAARADATTALAELAAVERRVLELAATLVATRDAGGDTGQLATRLGAANADRAARQDRLTEARGRLETGADALGAGLLDPMLPVLLLPVRLETRYRGDTLLVRIYPDDFHADSHEPALTRREEAWRRQFQQRLAAATDRAPWLAAWRELVAQAGLHRALWLATLPDPKAAGVRPGPWSRVVRAALLPDRFVAVAWTSTSGGPIRAVTPMPVREPLPLGPDPLAGDPGDTSPVGEAARWLHDFKAALAAGMALELPLDRVDATVQRLVVLGVRASVEPEAQAAELAALLDGHRVTGGLDLLSPGSATNALPGARPAYTSRPDPEAVYDDELQYGIRRGGLLRRDPKYIRTSWTGERSIDRTTAAFTLAQALGINPLAVGFAAGAGDTTIAAETYLRVVLRAAFVRRAALALTPGDGEAVAGTMFAQLVSATSAVGPLPVLRLGAQPYGVLPILLPGPAQLDPGETSVRRALDGLRDRVFSPAALRVPRAGAAASGDPGATLLAVLRADAAARELWARPLLGAELGDQVRAALDPGRRDELEQRQQAVVELLGALGLATADGTAIARTLPLADAGRVTRPWVAPADPTGATSVTGAEAPGTYLEWLRTLPLEAILDERYPDARPSAVLFDLCRLAVLEAADADARRSLVVDGGVDPAELDETTGALGSPRARLGAPAPLDPARTLAQRLSDRTGPEAADTSTVWGALHALAALPVGTLELLLTATLGLLTHRLDAWYTGLATSRLDGIRLNPPPGRPAPDGYLVGLGVGAFGWLERIPRRPATPTGGFVHAPSPQHAATAAVLLSADTAHQAIGHGDAFAVDLSSSRVRRGLELLDGVRAGQPLAALVGYQVERGLVEAGGTAPALVAKLRTLAPLVANRLTPSAAAAEAVAADNVVDGIALLRIATADGTQPANGGRLPASFGAIDPAQRSALDAILLEAADAVDAVADLLLAESVHHLVGGQPARAGAATDLTSGALIPPGEVEVVRTPQRGVATTHRVLVVLDPAGEPAAGWDATPRALAEPLIDAWAGSMLPPPSSVRVRARFRAADPASTVAVEATLAELLSDAREPGGGRAELALGALDVVLGADPAQTPARGALEARFAALVEQRRPAALPDAPLELVFERDPAWGPAAVAIPELLEVARELRVVLLAARSLRPAEVPGVSTVRTMELESRRAVARTGVAAVRDLLADAGEATATDQARLLALLAAAQYGVPVAPEAGRLADQVRAAQAELDARLDTDDATLPPEERLRAMLGGDLPVAARLSVDADVPAAFSADPDATGASPAAVRVFLSRAARVRDRVARLQGLLGHAEAVSGGAPYALLVAQRPRADGERWTALAGPVAAGRTSMVAVTQPGLLPGAGGVLAGLLVDEWSEVVPAAEADTSVAFQVAAPSSAAPNAALLCVPAAGRDDWSEPDLVAHVLEAIDLARMRALDPDLLEAAGQLLPAMLVRDDAYQPSFLDTITRPPGGAP